MGAEGASHNSETEISPAECLTTVKRMLASDRKREAHDFLQAAVVKYSDDPFLLSYFGYLEALIHGKYRNGIEACVRAISLFEKKALRGDGEESHTASLYFNLGQAYLASGKKKEAIEVLNRGLRYDTRNKDILDELKRLGIRKRNPIPFLDRSNPVNEIIGAMLRKTKN